MGMFFYHSLIPNFLSLDRSEFSLTLYQTNPSFHFAGPSLHFIYLTSVFVHWLLCELYAENKLKKWFREDAGKL